MVLDVCELDVAGNADEQSNLSAAVHVKKLKKNNSLVLLLKYVKFSVMLGFSKDSDMFSTACTPVLDGAGCSGLCDL